MKNMDVRVPPGTRFTLKQQSDKSWAWAIWLWTNQLGNGVEKTREEAERELRREAGKVLVKAAVTGAERAYVRTRLKDSVKKRPYLAAFVFEAWNMGLDMKTIHEQAESEEAGRHEAAKGCLGWEPLKRHHLAKPPGAAALQMMNWCAELGWDAKQANRWAASYLGSFFTNPDAAFPIEVTALKKKKRDAEEVES